MEYFNERGERECNKKFFFFFLVLSYSAHLSVAEELNLLDLAPLLRKGFLIFKAKK